MLVVTHPRNINELASLRPLSKIWKTKKYKTERRIYEHIHLFLSYVYVLTQHSANLMPIVQL